MTATTVSRNAKKKLTLETLFLSEKGRYLTNFVWAALILVIALHEGNGNVLVAFVLWFVSLVIIAFAYMFWYWLTTTAEERKSDRYSDRNQEASYTWWDWTFFPGSLLVLTTLALFTLSQPFAPSGNSYYATLQGFFGERVIESGSLTPHIPFTETVEWWEAEPTVSLELVAPTSDGKFITADVSVELALLRGETSAQVLAQKFGSSGSYGVSLEDAVERVFASTVGAYSLESLPSNLVLEDLIGTTIGLDGLEASWSGAIVVENIHRYAGE